MVGCQLNIKTKSHNFYCSFARLTPHSLKKIYTHNNNRQASYRISMTSEKNVTPSTQHFMRRLACFTALSIITILIVVLVGRYTDVSQLRTTVSIALLGIFLSALLVIFLEIKIAKLVHSYESRIGDLENLSSIDKLTGLANRLKLDEMFNYEIGKAQRHGNTFSILLLDLDRFKNINDNFGHDVGDTVLKETAQLLQKNLRKTDTVGRWSGEEFLIIAPELGSDKAMMLADKVRKLIAGHYYKEVGTVTCSMGLGSFHNEDSRESMTDRADRALYTAKENGRNRAVFGEA